MKIHGLSPMQRLFADILWTCGEQSEVTRFIRSLPAEFRAEAETVRAMMVAAVFDEVTETDMAEDLLSKYNKPE